MKVKFRVKKNQDFQKIIHDNKNQKVSNQVFILYSSLNDLGHARIGISTSKKLGCAVIRNRIRRQVRAMSRNTIDLTKGRDYIFIVRNKYLKNTYQTNLEELKLLLSKLKEN